MKNTIKTFLYSSNLFLAATPHNLVPVYGQNKEKYMKYLINFVRHFTPFLPSVNGVTEK